MNRPRIIELVYFKAGGGHVSTMEALKAELEKRYPSPEWAVNPVNLQEVLKPVDLIYKGTGKLSALRENLQEFSPKLRPLPREILTSLALKLASKAIPAEDVYNLMLKSGETDGLTALLLVLQGFIALMSWRIEKILRQRWRPPGNKPDLVVSVIPNFNAVMFRALKKIYPDTPFVTVMTDLADIDRPLIQSHFWIEKQAQFLVCGTDEALQQALLAGYKNQESVFQVSGMILKPCFYEQPVQTITRADLGLAPNKKTALIMFGGYGSAAAEKIVDRLNASALNIQTIVMCGRNEELYERLRGKANCCRVRFVGNVAPYMECADFFIGKPGPGSLSEALHKGLPVLVLDDKTTMPQERPNVGWIEKHGVGASIKNFENIAADVGVFLAKLDIYRENMRRLPPNSALLKTADILEKILGKKLVLKAPHRSRKKRRSHPIASPVVGRIGKWRKRLWERNRKSALSLWGAALAQTRGRRMLFSSAYSASPASATEKDKDGAAGRTYRLGILFLDNNIFRSGASVRVPIFLSKNQNPLASWQ